MSNVMMNREAETPATYTLTNKMFINTMLEPEDVTKIMRVFNWYLEKHCDRYAPIWVKEALYEEWLTLPFDQAAWASAGIRRSAPGSIPKDYTKSVRRFCHPLYEAKQRYSKKQKPGIQLPNGVTETAEGVFKCEMNANYKPTPTKI
jgi:hypothetical protein